MGLQRMSFGRSRIGSWAVIGVCICFCGEGADSFFPLIRVPTLGNGWIGSSQVRGNRMLWICPLPVRLESDFFTILQRGHRLCSSSSTVESDIGREGQEWEKHPIYHIEETGPHAGVAELALKNGRNLPLFLGNKAVAQYNREAFEFARRSYEEYCETRGEKIPLVLDSCCGTGRCVCLLLYTFLSKPSVSPLLSPAQIWVYFLFLVG